MTINRRAGFRLPALIVAFCLPVVSFGEIEAAREPIIRPAVDGIFEAFETHPLVGLADVHGVAQALDFYRTLIADPRFAERVGNVVVDFGGAAHQDVIDRYVNGETVPYGELRKVWTETVGWIPAVPSEGYARFFAQVREKNLALAPQNRIKVWLGEPAIDWSRIRTAQEYRQVLKARDSHAAEIIVNNILEKKRKALVIYGGGHFDRTEPWEEQARAELAAADPDGPMSQGGATLRDIVEEKYPGSSFVIQTYRGFQDAECTRHFEEILARWPMPALAVSVRGTSLEDRIRQCLTPMDASRIRFPPTVPLEVQERVRAIVLANADRDRPLLSDSLLFLAPASELRTATPFLEYALDEELRAELGRRNEIMTGRPLPPDWGRTFPSSLVPYRARDR